jgi:hypothetical protein
MHAIPFFPSVDEERYRIIAGGNIPDYVQHILAPDTLVQGHGSKQGDVGVRLKKIANPGSAGNFIRDLPDTPFGPGEPDLNKVRGVHDGNKGFLFLLVLKG